MSDTFGGTGHFFGFSSRRDAILVENRIRSVLEVPLGTTYNYISSRWDFQKQEFPFSTDISCLTTLLPFPDPATFVWWVMRKNIIPCV